MKYYKVCFNAYKTDFRVEEVDVIRATEKTVFFKNKDGVEIRAPMSSRWANYFTTREAALLALKENAISIIENSRREIRSEEDKILQAEKDIQKIIELAIKGLTEGWIKPEDFRYED